MTAAQYKRLETQFARAVGLWLRRARVGIFNALLRVLKKGNQRFTVMMVPHSKNRIYNLQTSFFSFVFFICTITVVVAAFALMVTHLRSANARLARLSQELHESEVTLQKFQDSISALHKTGTGFRTEVRDLRVAMSGESPQPSVGAEIASLFPMTEIQDRTGASDLVYVKKDTRLLESSAETMRDIGKILRTYGEFEADTPTLWPLKGVHGVITTRFGWTINPFTNLGYLHQGVDIAWGVGTPIVAAANGVVVQTGYNEVLGNYVTIQHKYGFVTRYLHMLRVETHAGVHVNRGDVIGYLGSTGLATGPHLHYEVHLGGNYLDPMNFLSIPPGLDAAKPQSRSSGYP